jgi:hypothetical protein
VHQIWQSQKVFSYIQVEDILQMNRIAKKANLIGCIHLNIRQSAQVFGSNKTDLKPKPNLHDFCSLKFYRYVYHFDTSGCFCGGTNKGKSSFLCITCSCRCCNSSSSALTFGFWLSPFWKKRFQEEDHIAYKQFLSLSKHVSHDVSKFK